MHLAMVSAGGVMAAAAVLMALACIPCAWGMWRAPTLRTARVLTGMSLGMALLHGALLLGVAPALHHGGMAGMGASAMAQGPSLSVLSDGDSGSTGSGLMMLAVMCADFTAAMLAASWLRRSLGIALAAR
ncbi:hypothetical protein LK10_02570 [Sinomonas humi]|uniref:Uncharacterized protein n=1 Tax=Sinomonas humi TaxID=1338436 RepID=A0A0B2ASD0_9MICC|nr:hypothetical protein LK10_02570 [Sinomonas humi]